MKTVIEYLNSRGIDPKIRGNEAIYDCPFCDDTKQHFAVNTEHGAFLCIRCDEKGSFVKLQKYYGDNPVRLDAKKGPVVPKTYKRPNVKIGPVQERVANYLESRHLSEFVQDAFGIGSIGNDTILFPFYKNGELYGVKYRPNGDKSDWAPGLTFWSESGCEPSLFGRDMVQGDALIICEGEIDAMSMLEYGRQAVSVHSGALSLQWLDTEKEFLSGFKEIYLCIDMDEKGRMAVDKIAKRMGSGRCKDVRLPYKDANECLKNGVTKEQIDKCFQDAKVIEFEDSPAVKNNMRKREPRMIKLREDFEDRDDRAEYVKEILTFGLTSTAQTPEFAAHVVKTMYDAIGADYSMEDIEAKAREVHAENAEALASEGSGVCNTKQERNIASELKSWVGMQKGSFSKNDFCKEFNITKEEMPSVYMALKRLCKDNVIISEGNRSGVYRTIDSDVDRIDWQNATTAPMDISWPFCLEELVKVYPGNIVVLAGAPNAGKSAFVYNFIKQNMYNHEVHLFSSEGGAEEMHTRLEKFGMETTDWRFDAWERSDNFADVIRPNAINVIDFLEVYDEFYKIGGKLKEISDKLGSGMALICLQKNKGKDEGLGGMRSLEKPRLYMAMDSGKLKIVKGKSWASREVNPNNMAIRFKIVDGCQFMPQSVWEKDDAVNEASK